MPAKNKDLHGFAPDQSKMVLIIIDVLNEFDFPEGKNLLRHTLPVAQNILHLKKVLKKKGVPVIYANDNFGKWKSNQNQVVLECLKKNSFGKPIAELLKPDDEDYFVLKPKHSAFFSTTLDTLLLYLGAEHLILTGIAGNLCVFHTALDAHVRDYHIHVPSDCIASNTLFDNRTTIRQLGSVLGADIRNSQEMIRKFKF